MKIFKFIFFILCIQLTNIATAQESELVFGRVDSYKLGSMTIIIGDRLYELATNLNVLNENKQVVSHAALTRGRGILYRSRNIEGSQRALITEIHLVRPGT